MANNALALIVEDDDMMRMVMSKLLEQRDLSVISAENGRRALDIVSGKKPDIIITDIKMPVMDGFEFIRNVRNDRAFDAVPIIAVSSNPDQETSQEALSSGADKFLAKSADFTAFADFVIAQLGRKRNPGQA